MALFRFAAYVVFGLIPATALGALAVFVLVLSFVTGAIGAVFSAFLPIAVLGLFGSVAFWASMFARPNDAIRLGLVCGIGAALLLLGFFFFDAGLDLFYNSWSLGVSACSLSAAIASAIYLAKDGRPRLRRNGEAKSGQDVI